MSVKLSDLIQQFTGVGDFGEWVLKLELVATLQGITTLETFLPLFLSGGAFAVYNGLSVEKKKDYKKLKQALLDAFSLSPFKAFGAFKSRQLEVGESVDVFVADLKRLAGLVDSNVNESWIKWAFVNGLPQDASEQMLTLTALDKMGLEDVVVKARTVMESRNVSCVVVATDKADGNGNGNGTRKVKCYTCGREGHVARNCMIGNSAVGRRCFNCGENGHLARFCSVKVSKNV